MSIESLQATQVFSKELMTSQSDLNHQRSIQHQHQQLTSNWRPQFYSNWNTDFSGFSQNQQVIMQQGLNQECAGMAGLSENAAQTPKRRRKTTPAQRKAANVRERRRMSSLNQSFDRLRRRVPAFPHEKRLSRIQTLRLAMYYISFMTELLTGSDVYTILRHQQQQQHRAVATQYVMNGYNAPLFYAEPQFLF